ncbi:MAG: hypothetical protein ACI8S6_001378, partial [Myxococcota bacterium]
ATAIATVPLTVIPNESPDAVITAPVVDGVYYSDQIITFTGLVSDEEDAATALLFYWESDRDGVLEPAASPNGEEVTSFATLSEGQHVIELYVEDSSGNIGSDNVIISVGPPSTPPTCVITGPADGTSVAEGASLLFEGEVDDIDIAEDLLDVVWESDIDGLLRDTTPSSDGSVGFSYSGLTVATHRVTMTVTDEVGETCSESIYVTVGTPPVLLVTAPTSGDIVNDGEDVFFQGTVSDGEDLPSDIALSWSSSIDGAFSTQGADSTGAIGFSYGGFSTGGHALTVRATDPDGLFTEATLNLTVNALPTAPTVSLSPAPAQTGDELRAAASGSVDPDASGTVTYSYTWYEDGSLSSASTGATFPSAATEKDRTYKVVVTPSDGTGDGETGEAEITITNTAPVVSSVSVSPSTAAVGDALTCSGSATDADGDSVSFSYAWADGSTGATYTVVSSDDPGDTITCTAEAADPDGGAATATATATVLNTAPVVTGVSVLPTSADNDDTLTCSGSATDADGDTASFSYSWDNATTGASLGTGSSLDLSTTSAASADTIRCTATAADPDGGTDSDSATLELENRAPTVSVSLSPDPAGRYDTLTCTASGSDPDGDSLTASFSWTVGGSAVSATSTAATSSTLAGAFLGGDEVVCTAEVDDSKGETDSDDDAVVITNQAPAISDITFSPDPFYTDDTLSVSATVTDDDGDSLTMTYAWYVGSSLVQSGSDSTLDGASWFDKDDEIYVVIAADDESEETSETSGTVAASNSAPTAPIVSIVPSAPEVDEALTCVIDTDSTDADGDAVDYSMAWVVDGEIYEADRDRVGPSTTTWTDDTVDSTDPIAGELWECTVTPSDSTDDGATASTSAQICYGTAESCPGTSCLDILEEGFDDGDGVYWIDPDDTGAFEAYCDMSTDSGGWTLLAQGGQLTCSTSGMAEASSVTDADTCSYLPYDMVAVLATDASEIMLQVSTSSFGSWSSTAVSTNSLAISALSISSGNWHNGATWDNWTWTVIGSVTWADGWPDMFQGSGSSTSVHWIASEVSYYSHDNSGAGLARSRISATWIR